VTASLSQSQLTKCYAVAVNDGIEAVFIGPIYERQLDTKAFLALPEAQFLIPIMVAVNDFALHDTIISNVQTAITLHRRDNDLTKNEMDILEAQLELLKRHSFGLVWECIELLKGVEKKAPTIVAFLNLPEIKLYYDLVKPYFQSEELCRIRGAATIRVKSSHFAL
jgi:hypothetical protein